MVRLIILDQAVLPVMPEQWIWASMNVQHHLRRTLRSRLKLHTIFVTENQTNHSSKVGALLIIHWCYQSASIIFETGHAPIILSSLTTSTTCQKMKKTEDVLIDARRLTICCWRQNKQSFPAVFMNRHLVVPSEST